MRLIDADALFEEAFKVWGTEADAGETNLFMEMINNAPTIAPPPNDPLPLKELREMELFEWLWIELIRTSKRKVFYEIKSAYYQVFEDSTSGKSFCCGWPGLIYGFKYEDYGYTWLAYRRKPEEVQHERQIPRA